MPQPLKRARFIFALGAVLALLAPLNTNLATAASQIFPGPRPFSVFVPTSYTSSNPAPLVIALTGYNQTGADFEKYLKLTSLAQADGFLYVVPDGSKDLHGIRFWNGTPECCDFQSPKMDDAAYIINIIKQVESTYAVDANRIYIIGHSNGGFLANNVACHYSEQIAAIVNMAGGSYTSASACKAKSPISVLEVWGTADDTYAINHILGKPIPGALKILKNWAAINQCSTQAITLPTKFDFDSEVPGAETAVVQYQGCPAGTAIDFWRMVGSGHSPVLTPNFDQAMISWLFAHPKVSTN